MVFIQPFGASHAFLIHEDLDPHPIEITIADLEFPGISHPDDLAGNELPQRTPMLGDYRINLEETMWIVSCFRNSEWHRSESAAQMAADEKR